MNNLLKMELSNIEIPNLDWEYISSNERLTEEFMEKYYLELNCDMLSRYQNMSYEFLKRNLDIINWTFLTMNKNYDYTGRDTRPIYLMHKNSDKIDWNYIEDNHLENHKDYLSKEYKNSDKIDWNYIEDNILFIPSLNYLENHKNYLSKEYINRFTKRYKEQIKIILQEK